MGSTGSGRFSDYSGKPNQPEKNGGSSGGSSGQDRCSQAFSVGLEDVAQYTFFSTQNNVPRKGTTLTLVLNNRLIAATEDGISVGAIPTKLNYLAGCLRNGFKYVGIVTNSSIKPDPRVEVDFVVK
jgi:hypothetical protein